MCCTDYSSGLQLHCFETVVNGPSRSILVLQTCSSFEHVFMFQFLIKSALYFSNPVKNEMQRFWKGVPLYCCINFMPDDVFQMTFSEKFNHSKL